MAWTEPRAWGSVVFCVLIVLACAGQGPPAGEAAPEAGAAAAPAETESTPPPAAPPVDAAAVAARLAHGIDLSHYNGTVDWAEVAAEGHTYAFVKASEGVDDPDPSFAGHWPAMKAAGLVRGAYHFYVTEDDPEEQARLFTSIVDLEPGDLVPVVDVETIGQGTQPGLADRLRTFLTVLEQHYGVKAIIYTGPNFWDANLDAGFGDHPLWVAEYGVSEPKVPDGWTDWHLWQYEEDAAVAGVEKDADLSHVNRDGGVDLGSLIVP